MHNQFGMQGVFLFGAGAMIVWLLAALRMAEPNYLKSHLIKVGPLDADRARALQERLLGIEGVGDAVLVAGDDVAYLKIDSKRIDMSVLDEFSVSHR